MPEGPIKYEFKIFDGSTPFTKVGLNAIPRYHKLQPIAASDLDLLMKEVGKKPVANEGL